MKRNLLLGLSFLCLVACKDKSAAPSTVPSTTTSAVASDDDSDGDEGGPPGRHGGKGRWGGGGLCKRATAEQWTALQKCNEKLPAEFRAAQDQCNTQVYGVAAPTKEQACDRDKRREAQKCLRDKNVKMDRELRRDFFQCTMGIMKPAEENPAPEPPAT